MKIAVQTVKFVPASVIFRNCDRAWEYFEEQTENYSGVESDISHTLVVPQVILNVLENGHDDLGEDYPGHRATAEIDKVLMRLQKMRQDLLINLRS